MQSRTNQSQTPNRHNKNTHFVTCVAHSAPLLQQVTDVPGVTELTAKSVEERKKADKAAKAAEKAAKKAGQRSDDGVIKFDQAGKSDGGAAASGSCELRIWKSDEGSSLDAESGLLDATMKLQVCSDLSCCTVLLLGVIVFVTPVSWQGCAHMTQQHQVRGIMCLLLNSGASCSALVHV